jgi:hypothetical protein
MNKNFTNFNFKYLFKVDFSNLSLLMINQINLQFALQYKFGH